MDCAQVKRSLKKYLGHSVEASTAQAVEEHLSICSACRDHLDGIMDREERKTLSRRLAPAAVFVVAAVLIVTAFQLRQASCGVKKESTPSKPLSSQQQSLEKAFKGDWVAVFYDDFSRKTVVQEFGITASFPQEQGEVAILDKTYRYFKVPSVLNAEALAKTINALQEKVKEPDRIVVSARLDEYLSSGPRTSETSIVYFYALVPAD